MAVSKKPKADKPKADKSNPVGRPPFPYDPILGQEICDFLETTPLTVQQICNLHPHFPSSRTIYTWLSKSPEFARMYVESKKKQVQVYVEQTFALGEDIDESNPVSATKAKINIELRKWYAARLMPRLYGDRLQTETVSAADAELKSTVEALQAEINRLKKHERDY